MFHCVSSFKLCEKNKEDKYNETVGLYNKNIAIWFLSGTFAWVQIRLTEMGVFVPSCPGQIIIGFHTV